MDTHLLEGLLRRSSSTECPEDAAYYSCRLNGFSGCCAFDPCDIPSADPCSEEGRGQSSREVTSFSTSTSKPASTMTISDTTDGLTSSSEDSTAVLSSVTSTTSPPTSATDSTFTTEVVSTVDSTGGPSSMTETVAVATSTGGPDQPANDGGGLSPRTIAGIAVGGAVGAIAFIFLLTLCIRRRLLKKRMSSTRGASPNDFENKSMIDQTQLRSPESMSTEDPVFGPFGGRANSTHKHGALDAKPEESWPFRHGEPREEGPGPSQLDSTPIYAELDSAGTQRSGNSPSEASFPSALSSPKTSPTSPTFHPSPLTPGFPGTQMSIQEQLNRTHRDSSNAPLGTPRATLNATIAERQRGQHATSWSNGL